MLQYNVGMRPIKLNMVVMKGTNDDEIESMIEFAINRGSRPSIY